MNKAFSKTRTSLSLEIASLLVLGLGVSSRVAYGQATASIVGTVTDTSGAAVANARISYAVHELSIGRYSLRVEPGCKAYDQGGITGRSMRG